LQDGGREGEGKTPALLLFYFNLILSIFWDNPGIKTRSSVVAMEILYRLSGFRGEDFFRN